MGDAMTRVRPSERQLVFEALQLAKKMSAAILLLESDDASVELAWQFQVVIKTLEERESQ